MRQGRSNALGFAGGIGGGKDVMLQLATELLGTKLNITNRGSGHLPHQPYLKM